MSELKVLTKSQYRPMICQMLSLPWILKLQRRPRPMPAEFVDLVTLVGELSESVEELRKAWTRLERKVYRDLEQDPDKFANPAVPQPQDLDSMWRTGDPAS